MYIYIYVYVYIFTKVLEGKTIARTTTHDSCVALCRDK